MSVIATIEARDIIRTILGHLGLPQPMTPRRASGDIADDAGAAGGGQGGVVGAGMGQLPFLVRIRAARPPDERRLLAGAGKL